VVPSNQRPDSTLWVFLDGDGLPWVEGGRRIAADPSPRNAVAFELFRSSPVPRAYLGRPCYFGHARDAGCEPSLWTSARYGEAVVASMTAALRSLIRESSATRVMLVGYSGGGALAYLIAPRVPEVSAVVTIAGNLDIDAWTRAHGFLPLSGSANPAAEPGIDRRITQIAIVAGEDQTVPRRTLQAFLDQQHPQELWTYEGYDHACCWKRNWPSILGRIRAVMSHIATIDQIRRFNAATQPCAGLVPEQLRNSLIRHQMPTAEPERKRWR
jgi:dienelactone hydrolase